MGLQDLLERMDYQALQESPGLLVLKGTGVRRGSEASLVWGYLETQDPWGHQALQGSLLGALLALQGPADLLGLATPVTVSFHPCDPSRAVQTAGWFKHRCPAQSSEQEKDVLAVSNSFLNSGLSDRLTTDLFCSLYNNIWMQSGFVLL